MKINQLKTIIKQAVREAIQEEIKDILLEAVKTPKQVVAETNQFSPSKVGNPSPTNPIAKKSREEIRENYMNVLSGMMPNSNGTLSANTNNIPLQVTNADTASPNGKLPEGNVSMDQIMGLMRK